jgi:putative DNA primase/helicase
LIIPLRDTEGTLHSLQFILPAGRKKFLRGGRVSGCYYAIGKPKRVLCIAEGFANAATIYQATGYAVVVAFTAGNLKAVAEALRAKYPDVRLIICADDDRWTQGNPDITKATAAATAVGADLAIGVALFSWSPYYV